MLGLCLGQIHLLVGSPACSSEWQRPVGAPYPSIAGMNLENTRGGRFASGSSDLAAVALPAEAPHLGSGTSP